MRYTFDSKVTISFTPEEFKNNFPGLDPTTADAEEVIRLYTQQVVDNFVNGKLITDEKHRKLQEEAVRRAHEEAANDFRYRH